MTSPGADGDLDARVFRRLAAYLGHAAEVQPDPRVLALVEEGRVLLDFEGVAEDEAWLVVSLPTVPPTPVLTVDSRRLGLHVLGGRLTYWPDALLDDDLPGDPVVLT